MAEHAASTRWMRDAYNNIREKGRSGKRMITETFLKKI
jgi:hypothetical protein